MFFMNYRRNRLTTATVVFCVENQKKNCGRDNHTTDFHHYLKTNEST